MQRINAADSEVAITCRDVLLRSPQNSTWIARNVEKKDYRYSTLFLTNDDGLASRSSCALVVGAVRCCCRQAETEVTVGTAVCSSELVGDDRLPLRTCGIPPPSFPGTVFLHILK